MEPRLSPRSKQKVLEILLKMEKSDFDEFDISELLRYIRPFSKKHILVWELACFIAHTEERSQGIVQEQLDETYANLIYGKLIKSDSSQELNIFQMDEKLFKAIFISGINNADINILKSQTNLNKKEALKIIRESYIEKDKIYKFTLFRNLPLILKILNCRFSKLGHSQILINNSNLKIQLTKCLEGISNELNGDFEIKRIVNDNFDDIKVCFMLLLHSHNFLMFDKTLSNCTLEINYNYEIMEWELALYANAVFGNNNKFCWKIMDLHKSAEHYIPQLKNETERSFIPIHYKAVRDENGKLIIK